MFICSSSTSPSFRSCTSLILMYFLLSIPISPRVMRYASVNTKNSMIYLVLITLSWFIVMFSIDKNIRRCVVCSGNA